MKKLLVSLISLVFLSSIRAEVCTISFPTPQGDKSTLILVDALHGITFLNLNGNPLLFWPNGFNSFYVDATDFLKPAGRDNQLYVTVEALSDSVSPLSVDSIRSHIRIKTSNKVHIAPWGIRSVFSGFGSDNVMAHISVRVSGLTRRKVIVYTDIFDDSGKQVASEMAFSSPANDGGDVRVRVNVRIPSPRCWSLDDPHLYTAKFRVVENGEVVDSLTSRLGIREAEYSLRGNLVLNGKEYTARVADVDCDALPEQVAALKREGYNILRTDNIPTPELVDFCDRIGIFLIPTVFDEWITAVGKSGYHQWFLRKADQGILGNIVPWAERDLRNVIRHYGSHASVLAWSLGPQSEMDANPDILRRLQEICEEER